MTTTDDNQRFTCKGPVHNVWTVNEVTPGDDLHGHSRQRVFARMTTLAAPGHVAYVRYLSGLTRILGYRDGRWEFIRDDCRNQVHATTS